MPRSNGVHTRPMRHPVPGIEPRNGLLRLNVAAVAGVGLLMTAWKGRGWLVVPALAIGVLVADALKVWTPPIVVGIEPMP